VFFWAGVAEGEEGEGGAEVGVAFEELLVLVHPGAVVALAAGEFFDEVFAPGVWLALVVFDGVVAEGVEGFGEGVVVVEEAGVALAGVGFEVVVFADPFDDGFDAGVVLFHAGEDHAFEAGVAHGSVAAEAAGFVGVVAAAGEGSVVEAAVVDFVGEGGVVVAGFEVLAAINEDEGVFDGFRIGIVAGGFEGVDEVSRVG
jgi:hypothetical protein